MAQEDFPRLLREWRTANGLSQAALAKRLGISQSEIHLYEKGKRVPSLETSEKLMLETNSEAGTIPHGQHFTRLKNRPLTGEEQVFAAEHHWCVMRYIRFRKLDYDEWYEILVFAYLKAVQLWFIRQDLHKYSFATIAYRKMDSAVGHEYRARKRRPRTVSLDDIIPGTENLTYGDMICDPRDCVRT